MSLFCKGDIKAISACASEYKLLDWIDVNKLSFKELLNNPRSNIKIDVNGLDFEYDSESDVDVYVEEIIRYENPNNIHQIEEEIENHPDHMDWRDWHHLCRNPNAIHLIEKRMKTHPQDIYWFYLYSNPNAVHLIEEHLKLEPVNWNSLYLNPNAIHLIEKQLKMHPEYIVLEEYWENICKNPNAIHLVKEKLKQTPNMEQKYLSSNPSIFELEKINETAYSMLSGL
jgi:hypothetical protein